MNLDKTVLNNLEIAAGNINWFYHTPNSVVPINSWILAELCEALRETFAALDAPPEKIREVKEKYGSIFSDNGVK